MVASVRGQADPDGTTAVGDVRAELAVFAALARHRIAEDLANPEGCPLASRDADLTGLARVGVVAAHPRLADPRVATPAGAVVVREASDAEMVGAAALPRAVVVAQARDAAPRVGLAPPPAQAALVVLAALALSADTGRGGERAVAVRAALDAGPFDAVGPVLWAFTVRAALGLVASPAPGRTGCASGAGATDSAGAARIAGIPATRCPHREQRSPYQQTTQ
ncbi:hypothetical protein AKJ08_0114 [Vulgatibacter incomptus]|uniref:Uncharacterized protein n=1 Tax=Vulgatibacter incomptus TaxID=1391653 RepID=A0A0K1P8A7_9BACT|nr:hypothetical protein AKJ08_0114 [Vulgatibacter incomptus]